MLTIYILKLYVEEGSNYSKTVILIHINITSVPASDVQQRELFFLCLTFFVQSKVCIKLISSLYIIIYEKCDLDVFLSFPHVLPLIQNQVLLCIVVESRDLVCFGVQYQ